MFLAELCRILNLPRNISFLNFRPLLLRSSEGSAKNAEEVAEIRAGNLEKGAEDAAEKLETVEDPAELLFLAMVCNSSLINTYSLFI